MQNGFPIDTQKASSNKLVLFAAVNVLLLLLSFERSFFTLRNIRFHVGVHYSVFIFILEKNIYYVLIQVLSSTPTVDVNSFENDY